MFFYIFWIVSYLVMKLAELIDVVTGSIFKKYFAWFGGLGVTSGRFLIYQPTTIKAKYEFQYLLSLEATHWYKQKK